MTIIRLSKTLCVAAMGLLCTLVVFGNLSDYDTNFAFVRHVLLMDTIFPDATISYRAIKSPALHHLAYGLIIAIEAAVALLCWIGAAVMFAQRRGSAQAFNQAKAVAIAGLTMGFLLWQVGFITIGGEWFGMWMSAKWNGVHSAFRLLMTTVAVLIFLALPDGEPAGQ